MASDYARKIKALLAKAKSTTNEHERDSYQAQATRLMAKWGVDDAMLAAEEDQLIITEQFRMEHQPLDGWCVLLDNVARGLGTVRVLASGMLTGDFVILYLVGHRSDVDRLKILWDYLHPQASVALQAYWDHYVRFMPPTEAIIDWLAHTKRAQFLASYGNSVGNRLQQEKEDATKSVSGSDLVLVDRKKQVDDFVDENIKPQDTTFYYYEDLSARIAGWTGGAQATLRGSDDA
jgi:hypothetical protein